MGITFANPLGLLGLLALPAIVVLHLFQRRFPRMAIAGLHLWGESVDSRDAGPKRERLPITRSLLLELLIALLLTLVVSRPRFDATDKAQHLVVVLDDSASMSAVPLGNNPPKQEAIKLLQERVGELPSGSVVTILLTGPRAEVIAGPGTTPDKALEVLRNWSPRKPKHDFQPAWEYAAQLAGETGNLLFITDRIPDGIAGVPKRMDVVAVGAPGENVGFATARRSVHPVYAPDGKKVVGIAGRVFLWVQNFGTKPATFTVRAKTAKGDEVFKQELTLPPSTGDKVRFAVPGGIGDLTVALESDRDDLLLDSTVQLVEPSMRPVKVAITLPKAGPAYKHVDEVLQLIPGVSYVPAEDADLIIARPRPLPESREDLWWLGIGPLSTAPEAMKAAKTPSDDYPFILERTHPLLKGMYLQGVRWTGVQPLKVDATPLITAGKNTLLGQLRGTETSAFILNVDLRTSSLPKGPDWAIFLQNLIEERRKALPGLPRWNYRVGEDVRLRLSAGELNRNEGQPLELVGEEEPRKVARTETVQFAAPLTPGVYELKDGDNTIGRFAVSFHNAAESDLTGMTRDRRPPEDDESASGFLIDKAISPVLLGLLLISLAALFADWYVLKPKRQRHTT